MTKTIQTSLFGHLIKEPSNQREKDLNDLILDCVNLFKGFESKIQREDSHIEAEIKAGAKKGYYKSEN